jgi:hypothetical protein
MEILFKIAWILRPENRTGIAHLHPLVFGSQQIIKRCGIGKLGGLPDRSVVALFLAE